MKMIKIPKSYLEIEYDINGEPFLVEKKFTRGEYLLLSLGLKDMGEKNNGKTKGSAI